MNDLIKSLALVGQCWRDKKYPLREQAISLAAPEFCLSAPSFELALDWIFSFWTEENIGELSLFSRTPPLFKGRCCINSSYSADVSTENVIARRVLHASEAPQGKTRRGNPEKYLLSISGLPRRFIAPLSLHNSAPRNDVLRGSNCSERLLKKGGRGDFSYTIQILAGTTPAMIAQGFLQGALLNADQCIKLPRQQTTFAYLLFQSFKEHAPELAALFSLDNGQDLSSFHEKLKVAELVIAYGHDETLSALKKYILSSATYIAHGHAESAAIIFKDAANIDSLEKLAYDMLSYDQRGCLSPRVTFIEKGGDLSPAKCAEYFAEIILPKLAQKLPRGGLFEGEAAEILHQRSLYAFRGKVYSGQDWTVCYDENLVWPNESLPRFMPFKPFNTCNELKIILPSLISIGYAGSPKNLLELKTFSSRLCSLGEMQKQCLLF